MYDTRDLRGNFIVYHLEYMLKKNYAVLNLFGGTFTLVWLLRVLKLA